MKINWGTGITIFYTIFVITMVSFVVYSMGLNKDLVREDYYNEDLKFQAKYDKIKNAKNLEEALLIKLDDEQEEVFFNFPKSINKINGKIVFYKPDNKIFDFSIPIQLNDKNVQNVSVKGKKSGVWKVKVDWVGDKIPYYIEQRIIL